MRRTVATLLLMAGALAPAIDASADVWQASGGGVGIRLLEAPTAREKDPRARRSIVDHVRPGASFSRRFEVSNTTDGRRAISVYAAAADVVGGEFVPADGRTQNDVSGWITLDTGTADLGPGQSVQPRLTVTVPNDAAAGERYAVVWAELPPSRPPGGGIAVVNRVGLRVYLSVGSGSEPPTDFAIESLTAERDPGARPVVQATVRNTGARALDLSGELRLTEGPGGLSAGPFEVKVGTTLAIGATEPVTVLLDPALPPGPWRGTITLRSGVTERTATGLITFPAGSGTSAPPVAVTTPAKKAAGSGSPLLLIGLLLAALLLAVVGAVTYNRRRRSVPAPAPAPLNDVLAELRTAEGARRRDLIAQAASYGKEAILASPVLPELPVQTARQLGERVAKSGR
ncbi:MAG: hypothetical protein QOE45_1334 [Frankiaceae bacterium]|jgi:hypothetical protein|nr:hypothetical protein [Frankiaceae bacterium]